MKTDEPPTPASTKISYIDSLVQDWSISIANALEILMENLFHNYKETRDDHVLCLRCYRT